MYNNNINAMPIEKIISILSYCTGGLVGFVFFIIAAIGKFNPKPFLKFHVYQSIFISILLFVISGVYNAIIAPILFRIPFINVLMFKSLMLNFTLSDVIVLGLLVYLCIGVLLNKYTYIPWVSDVIKSHV